MELAAVAAILVDAADDRFGVFDSNVIVPVDGRSPVHVVAITSLVAERETVLTVQSAFSLRMKRS